MSDGTPLQSPTKRITVRAGKLTVAATGCIPRGGGGGGGAVARELAGRGVHLADIHLIEAGEDPNELVVRFLFEGSDVDQAKNAIVDWALATGYARVWFRDELCDLTDALPPTGRVSVSCPTCSAHWAENDLEFWEAVREHGGFPTTCPACGGTLPQWTVHGSDSVGSSRARPDLEMPRSTVATMMSDRARPRGARPTVEGNG